MSTAADIAGLSTVVQRWTIVALAFLVYSVVLFVGSCSYGGHLARNAQKAGELADVKAEQKANAQELGARADLDHSITERAAAADATAREQFLNLRLEVPHVVATFVPSQEPARIAHTSDGAVANVGTVPLGSCVVGADFVGVWNRAIAAAAGTAELGAGKAVRPDPATGGRQ